MSDKKSNDSRRKLLKSLAAGSGAVVAGKSLPESWTKPIINSVILPSHATTTDDTGSGGPEVTTTLAATTPAPLPTSYNDTLDFFPTDARNSPLDNVLSVLVQDAHAVDCCYASGGSMCVDTSNAPAFTAQVLVSDGSYTGFYTGNGTIGSAAVVLAHTGGCNWFGEVKIAISSNDANGADYIVTSNNGGETADGTAPVGSNCPGNPGDCAAPSDVRLKTNIEALSTSRNGFNLYKFQYLADEHKNTYVGIMAQDIMAQHPEAIVRNEAGYYMVRYHELGLRMVTLEEWENKGPDSIELIN